MILPSVRAFFAGIIDYAGLFPPAKLPLDQAIANFVKYRAGRDAWMLGRFVIPATRLAELDAFAQLFPSGPSLPFSILGRGGETAEAFAAGVTADLEAVAAFRARHGASALVDAYEVKLPGSLDVLPQAPLKLVSQAGMSAVGEVPPTSLAPLFARMRGGSVGVKLRCGGLDAAAFPDLAQVAQVIAACRDNGLTLKCTAGLHHPLRHFDRGVGTKMNGFINVFGAGVLAHALRLDEATIRAIIEDEDAANFGFDELGFGWKQYHALIDEIVAARREFILSFGSCSFDEPRDDLRAMGILS